MKKKEKLPARKIASLIRTARKSSGLNQCDIAKSLGMSQSALSKMEHGILMPSVYEWFEFCKITKISPESYLDGQIERLSPVNLDSKFEEGFFKIPKRYGMYRGSKVRTSLPLLAFMKTKWSIKQIEDFFKNIKLDSDYLTNSDHQINLMFFIDLLHTLIQKGALQPNDIPTLTKTASLPQTHGKLSQNYSGYESPQLLLSNLLQNAQFYELNFAYELTKNDNHSFDIFINPRDHLGELPISRKQNWGEVLCQYKKSYFHSFSHYGGYALEHKQDVGATKYNVSVQDLECMYRGGKRCIYRLQVNA